MSNVKDGDIFMVSRDGTQFQVKNEDTSNLRDDDLFWVQRDGVNYSVTADQVNTGSDVLAPVLNSVELQRTTTGDRFTDQRFLTTPAYSTSGSPPPVVGLKGKVTGALSIAGATDEIVGITGNTLTLASDANLVNGAFKAGDAVKQNNSPIVPTTSPVTNVAENSITLTVTGNLTADQHQSLEAGLSSGADMGVGVPIASNINPDGSVIANNNAPNDFAAADSEALFTFSPPLATVDRLNVYGGCRSNTPINCTKTVTYSDGTTDSIITPSNGSFWYWVDTFYTGGKSVSSVLISGARNTTIGGVTLGGNNLVLSGLTATLTLTDDKDLDKFEVGDEIGTAGSVNLTFMGLTGPTSTVRAYSDNGTTLYNSTNSSFEEFTALYNDTIVNQNYWADDINTVPGSSNSGICVGAGGAVTGVILNYSYVGEIGQEIAIIGSGYSGVASKWKVTGDVQAIPDLSFTTLRGEVPRQRYVLKTSAASGTFQLTWLSDNTNITYFTYIGPPDSAPLPKITAIDEAIPSINTDGGNFNVGEVITGPSKDITATFVSADPSVPSMEVTDLVGPWSANTGNYVVNTVVNPVLIKPETSAITEVEVVAASYVKNTNQQSFNTADQTSDKAFNGLIAEPAWYCAGVAVPPAPDSIDDTTGFYWAQPITCSKFEVHTAGGNAWYNFIINGTELAGIVVLASSEGWIDLTQYLDDNGDGTFTFEKFQGMRNGSSGIYGWRVDGEVLVEGDTTGTLTFTDDTDLNQFAAGDAVYANQAYTPESSEIVGVSESEGESWVGSQLNWTVSDNAISAATPCYIPLELSKTGAHYWEVEITVIGQPTELGINYDTSPIATYKDSICGFYFNSGGSDPEAIVLMKDSVGNSVNTPGVSGHGQKLCLPNSTVGVTFPVGTVLMFYIDGATGNFWMGKDGQWLGTTNGTVAPNINPDPTTGTDPIATLSKTDSWWFTSLYNCQYKFEIQRTNKFGGDTVDLSFTNNKDLDNFAVGDAVTSSDGATGVISDITGLDMSLSQPTGTWELGDTVIGSTLPPASGTVASTATNTMTLSASNGEWLLGSKVTMDEKEALVATAALNFDANGIVSGLSSADPDHVNMNGSSPLLNFPSTFSDGKTPDETIPEGAYIQTEVRAWNVIGESTMKSNKVTPEATTRLSKGETKLIDGYTPVATAAARQTLAEAQKIEDDITKATDNLKLAISKYEEQGKRRSV